VGELVGDIGLEKLTEDFWLPSWLTSGSWVGVRALVVAELMPGIARSKLLPRPPGRRGGGEDIRLSVSRLTTRLCDLGGIAGAFLGMIGIGGASGSTVVGRPRTGDGLLKVLSVIDPTEPRRRRLLLGLVVSRALPLDDTDALLTMRFV